jgi:hypothetical protein
MCTGEAMLLAVVYATEYSIIAIKSGLPAAVNKFRFKSFGKDT